MRNIILKIPPPIFYITSLILGLLFNYFFASTIISKTWQFPFSIALFIVSFAIIFPVIFRYKKSQTPFDVGKSATVLITNGPNSYSRNPGYLSLTLLYLGIGLILNNYWILGLAIPIIIIMDLIIIRNEEKQLEIIFGEKYVNYKAAVRRWV